MKPREDLQGRLWREHPAIKGRNIAAVWQEQRAQRLAHLEKMTRLYSRHVQGRKRRPRPQLAPIERPADYALLRCREVLYPLTYANGNFHRNHRLFEE